MPKKNCLKLHILFSKIGAEINRRDPKTYGAYRYGDGGSSDAYCAVRCGAESFKTESKAKSLHPVWEKRFVIGNSSGRRSQVLTQSNVVKIEVRGRGCLSLTLTLQH